MKRYISQFIVTAFDLNRDLMTNMKDHLELKRLLNLYEVDLKEVFLVENDQLVMALSIDRKQYNRMIDILYNNVHEQVNLKEEGVL